MAGTVRDWSGADWTGESDRRAQHRVELRAATRRAGQLAGGVLVVAWPAWALFDHVHAPAQADRFVAARAVLELLIVPVWLALWHRRFGHRHAEGLVLLLLALPQVTIAWMIARLDGPIEPYLLGFSLPMYGSAVLLIWRPRMTAALVAVAAVALAVSLGTAPGAAVSRPDLTSIVFYGGTAAVIALAGQLLRHRLASEELRCRIALLDEQERSQQLLEEVERLSREDALTGVANRRGWDELASRAVEAAGRLEQPLAVVLCDVDHFKRVNDHHGHARGDDVLRTITAHLLAGVRPTDVVARLGGDEFAILCPRTDLEAAASLAARLRATTRSLGAESAVTISFGVAAREPEDRSIDPLLARADRELYRAKLTRDAVWAAGRRRDLAAVGH